MAEAPESPKERLDDIVQDFPKIGPPKPTTFLELSGARQMSLVLWVICGVTVLFLIAWWTTRPALRDAEAVLRVAAAGGQVDADKLVETLGKLQRDHTEQFRTLFQLVVMSALVPLFTLLAGYVFGRSHTMARRPGCGESER